MHLVAGHPAGSLLVLWPAQHDSSLQDVVHIQPQWRHAISQAPKTSCDVDSGIKAPLVAGGGECLASTAEAATGMRCSTCSPLALQGIDLCCSATCSAVQLA